MKNINLILLPISFILFLACDSCKKDTSVSGPINISGQVVDKNTNTPVTVAEVDLIERDGGMFGGGSSTTLQRMYADSNGKFTFSNVTINSAKTYTVLGYKLLYFNDGNNTVDVDENHPSNVIIPMQPMAWLKLHVKDTAPFDKYDVIGFGSPWGGGAGPFGGQNIDTFLYAQVYGNINTRIVGSITKNNKTNIVNKYLICPAFDTTLYNFFY